MADAPANIAYRWAPIQPLKVIDCSYDFSEIDPLQRQWLSIKERREESDPQSYRAFLERLDRSSAIETGIIEGLYTLDRGVTETLVQRGFSAELIDRTATNKDPQDLVRVLEDHRQTAEGVYHYIREGRPLSKTLIRSLHSSLTQHQPTYTAHDQFGRRFETPLDRGGFKTQPNNPTRPDGRIHEYCPPVQVDSEIDNLVEWHTKHSVEDYHPFLVAAWLHHAFSQIHPFQDGNGRVARALLNWHLVRAGYLSVVVSRDDRSEYIDVLEAADGGNLDAFIDFLVQQQKRTIQRALAEPEPIKPTKDKGREFAVDAGPVHWSFKVSQAVGSIVDQVRSRNENEERSLRAVTEVGRALSEKAEVYLKVQAEQIRLKLLEADMRIDNSIYSGQGSRRAWESWYEAPIVETAQEAGHWANFNEESFLVKLSITPIGQGHGGHPGLTFLISLHHTGRQLSGVMAATAFAQIEFHPHGFRERSNPSLGSNYRNCATNPFTFVWDNDANDIGPRFFNWIEEALSEALRYWQEFLG